MEQIDEQITDVPLGDIHWNGSVMTVGDRQLEPGRHQLRDGDKPIGILDVFGDDEI